jgi:hypothetical protein
MDDALTIQQRLRLEALKIVVQMETVDGGIISNDEWSDTFEDAERVMRYLRDGVRVKSTEATAPEQTDKGFFKPMLHNILPNDGKP